MMCRDIIIYSFILFLFVIMMTQFFNGGVLEGLESGGSSGGSGGLEDIGVTVGTYKAKIDALGSKIDSMQATVLGLLPTVKKNTSDNAKNQQAIQAIIANKDKTQ